MPEMPTTSSSVSRNDDRGQLLLKPLSAPSRNVLVLPMPIREVNVGLAEKSPSPRFKWSVRDRDERNYLFALVS